MWCEAEFGGVNRIFIGELHPDTPFDEAYFRNLHHRTLVSLYEWAGVYRDVDMSKGARCSAEPSIWARNSNGFSCKLERDDFLRDLGAWPRERFAERLAYYQGEMIALHPFHEINGRITPLFFDLIAIFNGDGPLDYSPALAPGVRRARPGDRCAPAGRAYGKPCHIARLTA